MTNLEGGDLPKYMMLNIYHGWDSMEKAVDNYVQSMSDLRQVKEQVSTTPYTGAAISSNSVPMHVDAIY